LLPRSAKTFLSRSTDNDEHLYHILLLLVGRNNSSPDPYFGSSHPESVQSYPGRYGDLHQRSSQLQFSDPDWRSAWHPTRIHSTSHEQSSSNFTTTRLPSHFTDELVPALFYIGARSPIGPHAGLANAARLFRAVVVPCCTTTAIAKHGIGLDASTMIMWIQECVFEQKSMLT